MLETLLSSRWIAVWRRNMLVWLRLFIPAMLGNFGEPLLYLLALGYGLGAFVGEVQGMTYLAFLASGTVCANAMQTASFEAMYSAYTRMEIQQTWGGMLATPLRVSDIVVGEAVWAATKSVVSVAAILLVAAALGAVADWRAALVLPAMFLAGFCFAALALIMTALARSYDFFMYYGTLIITPMMLLSGVFFPLDTMPTALQLAMWLLPLLHAVEIARPLMTAQAIPHLGLHLAVLAAYGLAALWLAARLLEKRLLK
jgi:lipooligosaccharide transport system permease protein